MEDSGIRTYPWGHHRRFNAYSNFFRKLFGGRVQKISIDAGFTCPNRDGSLGTGGCSFCNNDAFSPSYCNAATSISEQIKKGMLFHSRRYRKSVAFLAYFQSYSNTYAELDELRLKYEEALRYPGIAGIIIGTRPDCISDDKMDYISSLSQKYYVAVEYGVESCYDRTLERINRGHDFACSVSAIEKTAAKGINTGAHFIFGLPGESREDMMKEAAIISDMPLTTVKFHQLQIIAGTRMEEEYKTRPEDFNLFTWDEYREFFIRFLEQLNPRIIVERFTGESNPGLIRDKGWGHLRSEEMIRLFENRLEELDTWQGRLYKGNKNLNKDNSE
ncbi:MAG TPA: TIGR01212 family radical SAM protein [Bacteroidales bacterium]|nr:TIGR01212 family radical SAM protein [Bacteroidales bacterium]